MAEQRMGEMEMDRRLKKEVEMMNIKVENMRKMFLDTEIKRLAITEEELKSDKAGEGGDEVREVGKDVHQKLELVNIQVEQMKLSLADFYKQLRDRRDLSELEVETIKQEMKKGGGQSITVEMVKEVISIMQADPISPIYEKAVAEMGKEAEMVGGHADGTEGHS